MGKEYRISRSIRAQWFFEQFNKTLSDPKSHDELVRWQSMVLQVEKVLVTMAIIEKKSLVTEVANLVTFVWRSCSKLWP